MKHYVAGLLFDDYLSQVMLIRKNHPEWMQGKLNGIGGHIENGESPAAAMRREFTEETSLINPEWSEFAILSGTDAEGNKFEVHWFTATIKKPDEWRAAGYSHEPVNWHYLIDDNHSILPNTMMPNLQWLIEMARAHTKGLDRAPCHRIQEVYTAL